MTYTDTQLKQTLAKMLPPNLIVWYCNPQFPSQAALRYCNNGAEVLDTELLHLCWLVEETLAPQQCNEIELKLLHGIMATDDIYKRCWHATWQHRVIALAKVKGIEIV